MMVRNQMAPPKSLVENLILILLQTHHGDHPIKLFREETWKHPIWNLIMFDIMGQ